MTLIHDPSAIRYASTQEAYGYVWTLQRIEDDGAQVWRNAKGHEALVQPVKPRDFVPRPVVKDPSWAFDGIDELAQVKGKLGS